jgi:hypothetical protein
MIARIRSSLATMSSTSRSGGRYWKYSFRKNAADLLSFVAYLHFSQQSATVPSPPPAKAKKLDYSAFRATAAKVSLAFLIAFNHRGGNRKILPTI